MALLGKVLLHFVNISGGNFCACHIEYEIAEEAMNFIRYVAEFSREWGEPNARDMGRMTSQPKAKGEMYILNDGMDMKAKIAAMERRLEELEKNRCKKCKPSLETPLQAMFCVICRLLSTWWRSEINSQLHQKIENVESSQIKRMDEVQNDLSRKIDNLQDSISRFANLNTMQEKENSPSQPHQNQRVSMKWRLRRR
ncbi:hypothetical protein AAG906_028504 [Vitis piasezkii]